MHAHTTSVPKLDNPPFKPVSAIPTALRTHSPQVRLSHRGLSPYELSAALRHVLESYKSQRNPYHKQSTFSAKNARQATPVAVVRGDSTAAGSTGEAEADATSPTLPLPDEAEGNGHGPTAGPGAGMAAGRGNNQARTVAFAEDEGGPEDVAVSDAGASAAEVEEAATKTNDRVGEGGSSGSAAVAVAATEKVDKGATGGGGIGTKRDQASRSAFAEQDWRELEPYLAIFCHKVPHEKTFVLVGL